MNDAAATLDADWTQQQRAAIRMRDVSVSLSAGAGCGKTFVLTERFLSYFTPGDTGALRPDELHHLVAITFTDRAAREMRDRVRRECYTRLHAAADAAPHEAEYWAALVRALDSARISTIHSFCTSLLRTHAVEAGIDPSFEVLEQAQAETLLAAAVDDELRRLLSARDLATIELAAGFDVQGLAGMLRTLASEGRQEDFERWLATSAADQVRAWETFQRERIWPQVARGIAESAAARQILKVLGENESNHPVMGQRREALLARLPMLSQLGIDPEECLAELNEIHELAKVQGAGTAKNWDSAEAYETFKNAAAKLRDLIKKAESGATFDIGAAAEAAETGRKLLAIAAGARRRYAQRKQELAMFDFDDLLTRARALLCRPESDDLRRRLSSHIQLLLVDEFQDTDRTQVELVEALCDQKLDAGKLFFVGDIKQSIYRFRGADPDVFRDLRGRMPERGRLSLTKNFRSQPAILEFVNALFWHDLGADYEPLRPHRAQTTPVPAIEFLWAPTASLARSASEGGSGNRDISAPSLALRASMPKPTGVQKESVRQLRGREADWIARRIRRMLDDGELLVGRTDTPPPGELPVRAARPGDVAILFRALSDVELYEEALRRQGIDYYLVGGHAFYAQQEIFDLVNLLRALASPSDDVSLAGALRSGFFSLADETLFWLAQHDFGLSAGLFAVSCPAQIVPEQQARVAFAAATIARLRDCKDRLRICELIELAISLTGYDAALLPEFLGTRKLANLRKVIEQARSFQRGAAFGLADFIAELSEFVARQPKEALAATLAEDSDVVRLMTIHQAKGLEFPIVFVPDLERASNQRGERVRLDSRLGPLVQMPEVRGNRVTGGYELWQFMEQAASLDELKRLLYVATTRAKDYLVLSSGVDHVGQVRGPWMTLLAERFDLQSGQLIGPLPAAEARPRIRVTTEAPAGSKDDVAARSRSGLAKLDKIVGKFRTSPPAAASPMRAIGPVVPDRGALRQYSFSRLAGTLRRHVEPAEGFTLEDSAASDPLRFGTLVHAVMAAIDFGDPGRWRELVPLYAERHLSAAGGEMEEAAGLIERFMASPRADELARATDSLAEAEFLLAWPPDDSGDAKIILTGYIDRLYQDAAGRWHVLDFKTNRVTSETLSRVAADYELQMLVYGLAAERILGSPSASLTLHFLRDGQEHGFAWNAAARKRATALLSDTIAAAAESAASDSRGGSTYALAGGVL